MQGADRCIQVAGTLKSEGGKGRIMEGQAKLLMAKSSRQESGRIIGDPAGKVQEALWHPFRVQLLIARQPGVYAALQPPATVFQPSGLRSFGPRGGGSWFGSMRHRRVKSKEYPQL